MILEWRKEVHKENSTHNSIFVDYVLQKHTLRWRLRSKIFAKVQLMKGRRRKHDGTEEEVELTCRFHKALASVVKSSAVSIAYQS